MTNSMKQKADEEGEDPSADKWKLRSTRHKAMECFDNYSHFVHGTCDVPEDAVKMVWDLQMYTFSLLKKAPNKQPWKNT
jgi:hypothetical protein